MKSFVENRRGPKGQEAEAYLNPEGIAAVRRIGIYLDLSDI